MEGSRSLSGPLTAARAWWGQSGGASLRAGPQPHLLDSGRGATPSTGRQVLHMAQGPPCPQPHPPHHSPCPTRPWPRTSIHQGHPAQVLALSLSPSHRCPLPSRLPPSVWYLHTYCGLRNKPAADKGCQLGVGVAVGGIGSELHLRNTVLGLGGGHLVGSARSAALGAPARLAMPRSASGQPPRPWKHNEASRPCHRL